MATSTNQVIRNTDKGRALSHTPIQSPPRQRLPQKRAPLGTSSMQVTSIRLERELKERLRDLSGETSYQTLIRDILWDYVEEHTPTPRPTFDPTQIRATIAATARQVERCVLTGQLIQPHQPMGLGITETGEMVPLSPDGLAQL